ncbi:MAG: TPM domain-containing protein [Verrucomicrobiota bacterium]
MKTSEFHGKLNESRIKFAIQEAERKTSGEIRIFISSHKNEDPVAAAKKIFQREKMNRTQERNGVLLYISPRSQTYAVIGDSGITEKVGDFFWKEVVESIGVYFRKEDFTWGVVEAIGLLATALATHFPRRADDLNELSDQIMKG